MQALTFGEKRISSDLVKELNKIVIDVYYYYNFTCLLGLEIKNESENFQSNFHFRLANYAGVKKRISL